MQIQNREEFSFLRGCDKKPVEGVWEGDQFGQIIPPRLFNCRDRDLIKSWGVLRVYFWSPRLSEAGSLQELKMFERHKGSGLDGHDVLVPSIWNQHQTNAGSHFRLISWRFESPSTSL